MPPARIIFDSRQSSSPVRQVVSYGGCIITLYDDGTMIQHVGALEGDGPFILPPDMLGIKPVEIVASGDWTVTINMSDGSTLKDGIDCSWMKAHGYECSAEGNWAVHPSGELWFRTPINAGWPRDFRWQLQKDSPMKGVKKIASLGDDSYGCAILNSDGKILIRHSNLGSEVMQQSPWLDEDWIYSDITACRSFVHAINQHGQVILTHFDPKSTREGFVMWPLPESNAVSFPAVENSKSACPREVLTADGVTIFYTEKSDWRGKKTSYATRNSHISYNKFITGKAGGAWLQYAGAMIAMFSPKGRLERYMPPNIRTRSEIKAILALASV